MEDFKILIKYIQNRLDELNKDTTPIDIIRMKELGKVMDEISKIID